MKFVDKWVELGQKFQLGQLRHEHYAHAFISFY